MARLYEENETMKFIGQQNALVFSADGEYHEQIKEVIEAHKKHYVNDFNLIWQIGIDFFLLGFAMGKRADREAKKKKKWLV